MKLKLTRPLISFDVETTGIDIVKDRIVQLAISKITQQDDLLKQEHHTWLVNPGIPIPKEASEVHGIYDKDVIDKPKFEDLAQSIYDIIKGCDLLGYNSNRFDIPILGEHMLQCGFLLTDKDTKMVDAQVIYHLHEPRDLNAAYKFYCGEDLGEDAHDASADSKATTKVLLGQLEMYEDLGGTVEELHEASKRGKETVDYAGRLAYNDNGEVVYNFGKNKDTKVLNDVSYANWMLGADFPEHTKYCLREILGHPNQLKKKVDESDFLPY